MLAIASPRDPLLALEPKGGKPLRVAPATGSNGWRWHLVCQKPSCQGGACRQRRENRSTWHAGIWHAKNIPANIPV